MEMLLKTIRQETKILKWQNSQKNQDNCATSEAVDFQDNSVEGEENESSNKSD